MTNPNEDLMKGMVDVATEVARPPAKIIGKILEDALYWMSGGFSYRMDMRRIEREEAKKAFQKLCEEKYSAIPVENLMEPSTQLLANTISAADACVEDETLREMFATLLASSFDNTKSVHPRFPELLRAMSPVDAKILFELAKRNIIPVVSLLAKGTVLTQVALVPDVGLVYGFDSIAPLGILAILPTSPFQQKEAYYPLEMALMISDANTVIPDTFSEAVTQSHEIGRKSYTRGSIGLSFWGKQFAAACISIPIASDAPDTASS